ncbi:MAG TPA: hypothetical protein DCS15_09795 [Flavobacteriales bacterium]|nr:hypothetical protein [Flavobacteriales bacterium]
MKGLAVTFLIFISFICFSQEGKDSSSVAHRRPAISNNTNNFQIHLFGTGAWYSFQYEREHFNRGGMLRSSLSAGLSFWPTRARWSRGTFMLHLEANLGITAPKQKWPGHYLEFGIGTTLVNHFYKPPDVKSGRATSTWDNNRIGYRFEHPEKTWLLRAGYIMVWDNNSNHGLDLRNWLDVSVGWRF